MKKTDLTLLFAFCLSVSAAARADDFPNTTDYSSEFNYYGADQPFAHPSPPSMNIIPPGSYIPTAPGDFIPVSSQHVFTDSRLPTVADATVRVFIRSYDPERGVYVNQEVENPDCMLSCLRQGPVLQ
ncbi:hypothetical protein PMI26_02426 [Pseudomonas sp. GM33]|jgi:hypothetical protein|uniref:hypothetical protein n=1 Tax=unclassified Pseudomonas TaxID=196821 RepID=UPI0002702329|nr:MULTISPECIES: hypothetical protein [unclassified Pseudomonas]EJM43797.1 hypothetical protein PMI26_02426 [Pseudomonas sp. GM33]PVZ56426.1 hypothetical protein C9422_17955 [Pseudomonas sp. B1(2018)]